MIPGSRSALDRHPVPALPGNPLLPETRSDPGRRHCLALPALLASPVRLVSPVPPGSLAAPVALVPPGVPGCRLLLAHPAGPGRQWDPDRRSAPVLPKLPVGPDLPLAPAVPGNPEDQSLRPPVRPALAAPAVRWDRRRVER